MKNSIIGSIIILAVGALTPQIATAQGSITYLSNLNDPSSGSLAVGSDAWFAQGFISGNNPGGYELNSVQLVMADDSGNPSSFTVMLYEQANIYTATVPGSSLGSLSGSLDPVAAGTYTYTAPPDLVLLPNTPYFIVVTAGTTVATGAYEWISTSTPIQGPNSYHWGGGVLFDSSGGLYWYPLEGNYGQFSMNATPIPEPGALSLLAMGGLLLAQYRRKSFGAA